MRLSPSLPSLGLATLAIALAACAPSQRPPARMSAGAPPPAPRVKAYPAEPIEGERFEKIVLAEGLHQPMEMEVLPDGRVLFIEISGDIRLYKPQTKDIIQVGHLDVFTPMENGLLGLALDPNFAKNHWIYLFYSAPGSVAEQHISRFTLDGEKLDPASERILLRVPTQRQECCHQAGSIEFGPDGCLFIATGDNTNPFDSDGYSPTDYRNGRGPWDAGKSAGNTNDLRGKILRIHPESDGTYTIPKGNLFDPADPAAKPEVYVMGCRNPFRIAVDQATDYLYWGEVGPDAHDDGPRGPRGYDEVNQARKAGNFGWPYVIADNQPYAAYNFKEKKVEGRQDPAAPVNHSPSNTGHEVLPPAEKAFIWYPYDKSAEFPVVGTGGRTACAGPVYDFDPGLRSSVKLPVRFDRCLLAYDWERAWIKAVKLDENSNIVWIEDFAPRVKLLRPVQLKIGPEGDLYVLEYGSTWGDNADSKLSRIKYFSGNRPPIARASGKKLIGKTPLKAEFTSEGSTDREGDPLTFHWDFGDSGGAGSEEPNPIHVYEKAGTYHAKLTVKDPQGAEDVAEVIVRAGNEPPTLRFLEPSSADLIDPTKEINYRIEMKDLEDSDTYDAQQLNAAVYLTPFWRTKRPATAEAAANDGPPEPKPLTMMKLSNCFNCHAIDRKVVGPSYHDVSERYVKASEEDVNQIIQRVMKGSTGVWGDVQMLPHEQHSEQELREMVGWVLSLARGGGTARPLAGNEGKYLPPKPEGAGDGVLVLSASYTDWGAEGAERLEGKSRITLRGRRMGAEFYDHQQGTEIHDTGDGGQMVTSIHHGDWIEFDSLRLGAWSSLACRVSAFGRAGGRIEMRLGSPEGEVISSTDVPITGASRKWVTVEAPLRSPGGDHDVYFVFVNAEKPKDALFDLNWVEFK